jgi:hypothetical protein
MLIKNLIVPKKTVCVLKFNVDTFFVNNVKYIIKTNTHINNKTMLAELSILKTF